MLIRSEADQQLMQSKIRKGIAKARAEGKCIGRPPLRHFSIEDIQRLREERVAGASITSLSIKYCSTVWKVHSLVRDLKRIDETEVLDLDKIDTEKVPSERALQMSIWANGDLVLEANCLALERAIDFFIKQQQHSVGFVAFGLSEEVWFGVKEQKLQVCQVCRRKFRFIGSSQLVLVKKQHGGEPSITYFPCCSLDCREVVRNLVGRLKQEEETKWLQIKRARELLTKARALVQSFSAQQSSLSNKLEQTISLPSA